MKADTWRRLDSEFEECPETRADSVPSIAEIVAASNELGVPFHPDYVEFLRRYGGAMVGANPILGLRPVEDMGADEWSVVAETLRCRKDGVPGAEKWIVFSYDLGANPIGLDANGKIWIYDPVFGGIDQIADSFEEYLRLDCLEVDADEDDEVDFDEGD